MDQFIEYFKTTIPAVILGLFGGFVSLISGNRHLTLRYFFGGILLSIFTVLILDAAIRETGLKSSNIWAITMYMGGYCSRKVVEIIERRFLNTLKERSGSDVQS